jgi:hypothetical protein
MVLMRRMALVMAMLLATTACGDSGAATESTPPVLPSTTTTLATTTTSEPVPILAEDVPALALFLAAIDDAMAGTSYEGQAFEDPESFIVTGRLFCELLDEGLSIESVLGAYVAALGSTGDEVAEDDYLLGGVVLGASVRLICPEYGDALDM